MTPHIFVLFGTRPEAIKLFPLIELLKLNKSVRLTVCVTAQHRDMLDQVLTLTGIVPDIDLNLMERNQSLDALSSRILLGVGQALDEYKPDRLIVQGDTATTMVGALAAYYRKIPVSHVEAGLRSDNIYSPWPEEVNRKIVGAIADQHFAPTSRAAESLVKENIPKERIFITGNTGVDALLKVKGIVDGNPELNKRWADIQSRHDKRKLILVTTHRRENFGGGMDRIVEALINILNREDVYAVLPVHPNPNVTDIITTRLSGHSRVELISPQGYEDFVALLSRAHLILTDSGGIQEEAPALGKPVLVLRDTTERPEGVIAGTARLVGTDDKLIVSETFKLLDDRDYYLGMAQAHNPFGDGNASSRIMKVVLNDRRSSRV